LGLDGVGTKPPAIEGEILSPTFVPTNRELCSLEEKLGLLRNENLPKRFSPTTTKARETPTRPLLLFSLFSKGAEREEKRKQKVKEESWGVGPAKPLCKAPRRPLEERPTRGSMALEQSPLFGKPSRGRASLHILFFRRRSWGAKLPLDGFAKRGLCPNAIEPQELRSSPSLFEQAGALKKGLRGPLVACCSSEQQPKAKGRGTTCQLCYFCKKVNELLYFE
jgi:hypothetical protein